MPYFFIVPRPTQTCIHLARIFPNYLSSGHTSFHISSSRLSSRSIFWQSGCRFPVHYRFRAHLRRLRWFDWNSGSETCACVTHGVAFWICYFSIRYLIRVGFPQNKRLQHSMCALILENSNDRYRLSMDFYGLWTSRTFVE